MASLPGVFTGAAPGSTRFATDKARVTPGGIHAMCRTLLVCFWMLAVVTAACAGAAGPPSGPARSAASGAAAEDEAVWGEMPAGARPVYIGIHGGTVPVSLLTAGDGSPMIAQVGLTGTDFLHFMRRGVAQQAASAGQTPASLSPVADAGPDREPAADNGKDETGDQEGAGLPAATPRIALPPGDSATLFLAGRAGDDVPVIYATGKAFERMSLVPDNWAPFGLTEKPLSVEGEVKILTLPKRLPRRGRSAPRRAQN